MSHDAQLRRSSVDACPTNSIYLVNVCMHASSICLHYSTGLVCVHTLFIVVFDNVSHESERVSCL